MTAARTARGAWLAPIVAAAAILCPIPASGEDDDGLSVSWLAHGQYVLDAGDVRKLLEDHSNLSRSGFVLDHFLLTKTFAKGLVLDLGLALVVPDEPRRMEALVSWELRRPGRWTVWSRVGRGVSYFDDSIGSVASASGLYPSHALDAEVSRSRDGLALGFALTPSISSRIALRVERSCLIGALVPLYGSRSEPGTGYVFEYPALWDLGQSRAGVVLDAVWARGGLDLSFTAAYRFIKVDDSLSAWRLEPGPVIAGANVFERKRTIHSVSARLGAELHLARPVMLSGGYRFGYTHTGPSPARDAFGDVWRVEYGAGTGGIFTHTIPLGVLVRPAGGLALRLRLVGSYSHGGVERTSAAYLGDPGAQFAGGRLESGVESVELTEGFELAVTRLAWMDLKLRQRLELEKRDLFRALFDTYEPDGADLTTAEDVALETVRNRVESVLRFKPARGLILDARVRFDHTWQSEHVEQLIDWISYGESRAWNLDLRLRLRYRPASALTLWVTGRFFKGSRFRPEVRDADSGYVHAVVGFSASAGIRAAATSWLSAHASYSYTHGDYEVGPAPLLGDWDSRFYRGRIHVARIGLGLTPLAWFGVDGGYQLALVEGSAQNMLHRLGAEARFRVLRGVHIGVGYLGRVFVDGPGWDDDYSGHAIRALVSGSF